MELIQRKYPHLSAPIQIGNVVFRNRMAGAPMSFPDLKEDGLLTPPAQAFYELRAKGGAASVTISECVVHPTGKSHAQHIDLAAPGALRGFALAANAIKRHGAVASLELSHGGLYTGIGIKDPEQLRKLNYGPSDFVLPNGALVTEMPVELIHEIAQSFGTYAALCRQVGFNMIMLHAGHGWLLNQFMSPRFNLRKDEYGGSLENRVRFLDETLTAIRREVGPAFPIELRMSGNEVEAGGYDPEEAARMMQLVEDKISLLHVSAGNAVESFATVHPSMFQDRGCNVQYAAEIKKHVKVPVAAIGALDDPEMMEEIVASGKADVVVMARALLADPEFPNKVVQGRDDEITPCMRCFTCHSEKWTIGLRRCAVNPVIGREEENRFIPQAAEPKKVLVVGGGPGGLMAAITAAKRGHRVILFEKEKELGGALRSERKVPFKKDLYELPHRYGIQAKKLGVEIRLGTPLTPEAALAEKPDAILCAVGADPFVPRIPGIDSEKVVVATHLSDDDVTVGENVVIMGGGLVGCEMSLHLAMEGRKVTVVEMLPRLCGDANMRHRPMLLARMEEQGVQTYVNTRALRVTEEGLVCADENDREILLKADTVVCAAGMRARRAVVDSLRDCAPVFMEIGDCVRPANVVETTTRAYYAALDL